MLEKRVLVSFDDICPFQCKHCYTLDIKRPLQNRSISEIVSSLSNQEFDIIYVSQRRDNFSDPQHGLELCEALFQTYSCNLFIITRNVFNNGDISRLIRLKEAMNIQKKELIVASSVFATTSYTKSENPFVIPSPFERLSFLRELYNQGVPTITLIRPIFPDKIIPIEEIYEILDYCKNSTNCVVSSGLAINKNISWRLGINWDKENFLDSSNYLEGAMEGPLRFLDVSYELDLIKKYCSKNNLKFFDHTMQALNFIIQSSHD